MRLPLSVLVSGSHTSPLPVPPLSFRTVSLSVCPLLLCHLSLWCFLSKSISCLDLLALQCIPAPLPHPPPPSPHSIFLCPFLTCLLAPASLQLYSFQGRPGRGMLAGKLWSCNSPFFPLQRSRFLRGLLDYFWRLGAFRLLGS